ncbi:16008_t:CDS:2 [Funneliformis geosporum]|uniref:3054_t:CDS:1 n=1 Tax=Funneliformis geosporum TaxID=1117311 RepID=A0A9W4SEU7_9GLOM|nr:16008_t:CDS:2 [Funneliformis geosporum]CAI2165805.1 3054_t:CDS:2 [Funneliformis geosporum]
MALEKEFYTLKSSNDKLSPDKNRNTFNALNENIKKFLSFVGPGYVIAVGYLDPGNWATDLSAGSQFGYRLLFVLFFSNIMTIILQSLSIKLGVVTGLDLAQACKVFWPKYINYILYILCELAIIACDLAEVIGSAIALKLLFSIPLPWGVAITGLDVMVLLLFYRSNDMQASRILESLIMTLIGGVGICFILEVIYSKPDSREVLKGFSPNLNEIFLNSAELYVTIGLIGATVMPHNLYLHSHLVKNTIKLSIIDLMVALLIALFVNLAILIVSASNFYYHDRYGVIVVANLFDAYNLLKKFIGQAAATIFAFALLLSGQSSMLAVTIAGQIVMEGFIGLELPPWLRGLFTRSVAILPAMFIAIIEGSNGLNSLLISSQVILSLYLPFAVIPLIYFTSTRKIMKVDIREIIKPLGSPDVLIKDEKYLIDFSNSLYLVIISCIICIIILVLDLYLIYYFIKHS